MKEAIGMVVGVVITLVSLVSFIDNTFVPYRAQQAFMAQSNQTMMTSLNAQLNGTTTTEVSGSTVKSIISSSSGSSTIYVNGVLYSSSMTINDSDTYTQAQITDGSGNSTYYFQKK
jgi:hypothetical protein